MRNGLVIQTQQDSGLLGGTRGECTITGALPLITIRARLYVNIVSLVRSPLTFTLQRANRASMLAVTEASKP